MTAPSSPLPNGLRARVLDASKAARSAGRGVPAAPEITAQEAFSRAADAFIAVLATLTAEQWATRVLRELDVQGLVGHLTGVEHDVQRAIAGDPDVADANHVASTQSFADAETGREPAETRAEFRAAVDRTLAAVADVRRDDGAVLSMHGMRLTIDALLVVRAFELWTHENDIRTAVGLPPSVPDPSTLTLMTDLAVRLLPHGVTRSGSLSSAVDLHLVLTGAGGGTWDVHLGATADELPSDVMIVVDAVDFCRLVANRVEPAALDLHVDGDAGDAHGVLLGAASLALD